MKRERLFEVMILSQLLASDLASDLFVCVCGVNDSVLIEIIQDSSNSTLVIWSEHTL